MAKRVRFRIDDLRPGALQCLGTPGNLSGGAPFLAERGFLRLHAAHADARVPRSLPADGLVVARPEPRGRGGRVSELAVLLCAGGGTRLRPLTDDRPKAL